MNKYYNLRKLDNGFLVEWSEPVAQGTQNVQGGSCGPCSTEGHACCFTDLDSALAKVKELLA